MIFFRKINTRLKDLEELVLDMRNCMRGKHIPIDISRFINQRDICCAICGKDLNND
jgi:hypothetical protein